MNMTQALTNNEEWNAFSKQKEQESARTSFPSLPIVKLNGKEGVFKIRRHDSASKEWTEDAETPRAFSGVMLAVRYSSKSRYKENATVRLFSREFSDFQNEPVTLYRKEGTQDAVPKTFDSYHAMKEATAMVNQMTGEKTYPLELLAHAYVLMLSPKMEVVKVELKGASRSAFFDAPDFGVDVVEFGVSEPQSTPAGEEYYFTTFANGGPVPVDVRGQVMQADRDLKTWLAVRDGANGTGRAEDVRSAPVAIEAPDESGVSLESIPF